MPKVTYRLTSAIPEVLNIDAQTKVSHYLGFLAGYYKRVSPKVVIGLGLGTPSAQGTMWNGADFTSLTNGTVYDWSSRIYVFSFSPMVAVKLSEAISVGAAINVEHSTFTLKMPAGTSSFPPQIDVYPGAGLADLGQYEENMNGWGFGATFGILVKPVDKLSIGLTVRTPSTIAFEGAASMSNMITFGLPGSSDLRRKITWPLWIAGGISFRPVERLLLSADVHWTQWSKLEAIRTTFLDAVWADLSALEGRDVRVLDWRDATQIRVGAEYILNDSTAVRAGYTNDPAPGPDSTLNVFLPSHTFHALSVGIGKTIGGLQLDFGLEYLAGNTRHLESLWMGYESGMPGTFGMNIVVPTASVSYKF